MIVEVALSVAMLAMFLWELAFRLPKACRERDASGVGFSLPTCLIALFGWLFIGVGTRSR
ncbi:MAG: hypothetical protein EHM24_22180 [Acidobacteria bacterium]|nr:MAG: hypothetical protein EHM24_22180 [Acidobacteriota bacterium]